jgi:CRISPR-associated Csx11 family protein
MVKNMIEEKIGNLRRYCPAIIYGEIGALIHDLGKCDEDFIKSHQRGVPGEEKKNYRHHTKILDKDKELISDPNLRNFFSTTLDNLILPFIPSNAEIIPKWGLASISFKDFIGKHHDERSRKFRRPDENLIFLTALADKKDSADDRLMPLAGQEKGDVYYKASVFGNEREVVIDKLNENRRGFYRELASKINNLGKINSNESLNSFRQEMFSLVHKYFNDAIAETRRAANDVSLWEHSYVTASIMKAFLVQDVLDNFAFNFTSDPRKHWSKKLKILGIGWDATRILREAQDILGISGREQLIEKLKETIKEILEFEIPVGNCIYEDTNSVCFLVPENIDVILEEIKRKVVSEVTELSDGVIVPAVYVNKEANPYPSEMITKVLEELSKRAKTPVSLESLEMEDIKWAKEWDKIKEREVCVECGKRPRMKDREICWRCQRFRTEGLQEIKGALADIQNETVWLDEIADKNGNIALICGSIPLEMWLDGELLKTIFVKTLEDILDRERKIWEKDEYNRIKEELKRGYSGTIKILGEFLSEIKSKNYNANVNLLQPFLSDDFQLSKKELKATYLSLKSRFGSDEAKEWAVGLFTKPPSPSRLLRIWNETQAFFNLLFNTTQAFAKDRIGGHCVRLKIKPRLDEEGREFLEREENKYQTYDLEKIEFDSRIKLPKTDLWWDGKYFHTTTRIENYTDGDTLKEKQGVIEENIENLKRGELPIILRVKKSIKGKKEEVKVKIGIEDIQKEEYLPIRKILVSPTTYQVLVPSDLAFDLVREHVEKYESEFGKVRGRLSLNFGCLFFKRKTPISAVLDGAGRLVESMRNKSSDVISLGVKRDGEKLEITSKSVGVYHPVWKINSRLGNGKEDLYYPNFFVKDEELKEKSCFEVSVDDNKGTIINFSKLEDDEIFIYPSLFDYQFLESSVDRFRLSFINQRKHDIIGDNGPRPYLLEDVEKFQWLKEVFDRISSWTPIRDVEALAISKRLEWSKEGELGDKKNVYEELIDSSLENKISKFFDTESWKNNIKPFLLDSILEGSFFDAIELFKSIMKMELKGGEEL